MSNARDATRRLDAAIANAVKAGLLRPDLSDLARGNVQAFLPALLRSDVPDLDIVRRIVGSSEYTVNFPGNSAAAQFAIEHVDRWLAKHWRPVDALPPEIQESPVAPEQNVVQVRGRLWSYAFAWHLAQAAFALRDVAVPELVVELGPGYGGLARIMKTLLPGSTHVLIDLPDGLSAAYAYLALNYPGARLHVVEDMAGPDPFSGQHDFVFLPYFFRHLLNGRRVDMFVDSLCLGHMPQAASEQYARFIEDEIDVRVLVNANRYRANPGSLRIFGQHFAGDLAEQRRKLDRVGPDANVGHAALWGPGWDILDWRLDAGDAPPFPYNDWHFQVLFLKLARRDPRLANPAMDAQVASQAFEEAVARGHIDSQTHRLLWLACQRSPQRRYIEQYMRVLDADASPVADGLRAKLAAHGS